MPQQLHTLLPKAEDFRPTVGRLKPAPQSYRLLAGWPALVTARELV